MSMSSRLLRRAIDLYREGKTDEANQLLKAVVRIEPDNQIAWNWYIETLTDPQERIHALEEYLIIFPESQQAARTLEALNQQAVLQEPALEQPVPTPEEAPIEEIQLTQPAPVVPPLAEQPKAAPAVSAPAPRPSVSYGSVLAVLAVILLAALFVYTYKLQQDYNTLQTSYDALQASYTDQQIAYEAAVQEKDALQAQLDDMWVDYEYLNNAYKNLTAAYNDLEARFNTMALTYIAVVTK